MKKANEKLIVLTHPVHFPITEEELESALSPGRIVDVVPIKPATIELGRAVGVDWSRLARTQAEQYTREVVPLLEKHPDAVLVYAGIAPIPLAVHLGFVVGSFRNARVLLRHHVHKNWVYEGGVAPKVVGPQLRAARDDQKAAIISVATTIGMDMDGARAAVGESTLELSVETDPTGNDVLSSEQAVGAVVDGFRRALSMVAEQHTQLEQVDLFVAGPVGLAFLLGTAISPTQHPRVQTYQYQRLAGRRFEPAIMLGASGSTIGESCSTSGVEGALAEQADPVRVLLVYAHEDKPWSDDIRRHLAPLSRRRRVDLRSEADWSPGTDVVAAVEEELTSIDLVVVLVSSHFHVSTAPLVEKVCSEMKGSRCFLAVAVGHCVWDNTDVSGLRRYPKQGVIPEHGEAKDASLTGLVQEILRVAPKRTG